MSQTDDAAGERLTEAYGSMSTTAYAILNGSSCVVALVAWLAVLQLLVFHIGLISRGATTYEFIIAQARPRARPPTVAPR